ncbi:MAG: DUF350 domain-containing protein [Ekhidna sp.]|nr:DUF350 domain-containing protein [Ekhidna sp.]
MILLDGILTTLTYILAGFVLFMIGKAAYKVFNPKVQVSDQLVEHDNFAFAFSYVGYFVGLLIALGSALRGESDGLIEDLIHIATYGLLSIVLLNLSRIINNKLILSKFDLKHAIVEQENAGAGIIQGANSIAVGLIVYGAITGEGYGFGGPEVTAVLYWALGQGILFVTTKVYDLITPYSIQEHVEKGNVAVAIGFSGAIVAIANLICNALLHDFQSWLITLEDVAFEVVLGLLFLPLARLFCDKILLPGQNLTDELVNQEKPNIGAALVEAFAYAGGSMLIVWAL